MDWAPGGNEQAAAGDEMNGNIPTEPTTNMETLEAPLCIYLPDIDIKTEPNTSDLRELSYMCVECPAKFRQDIHLLNHLATHTGEKPYPCTVCSSRFTQKSSLNLHMKLHNDEKPYKCSYCAASFKLKLYLQCHERRHTGERPFSCHLCGSKFTQKSSLNTHLKMHTDEERLTCPECPATFKSLGFLNSHLKSHAAGKSAAGKSLRKRRRVPEKENAVWPVHSDEEEDENKPSTKTLKSYEEFCEEMV